MLFNKLTSRQYKCAHENVVHIDLKMTITKYTMSCSTQAADNGFYNSLNHGSVRQAC